MMYSFRERDDTTVVDEPLYGHYLATTGVEHPGGDQVMEVLGTNAQRVIHDVILGPYPTPVVFFKNMAHHLAGLDTGFLDELVNVLLTRDPREMLTSLIKQLPNPAIEQTGLPDQMRLVEAIVASGGEPLVVESRTLLTDPPGLLAALCERIGVTYTDDMLRWEAGPKPEDGVWAPHWYDNVHRSTGFGPYRPKDETVPDRLTPLLEDAYTLYERISRYRLY